MRTLIISRLAVFVMLFAIIALASFKTENRDLTFVSPVAANDTIRTFAADTVSDFDSATPVFAGEFLPTDNRAESSAFTNANFTLIDRTERRERKRVLPENWLTYRQTLFDYSGKSPFTKLKERQSRNVADRRPNKNKSSPLLQ